MSIQTRTQEQLKQLGYPRIGIQLKDGSKLFGKVTKFTQHNVYFKDENGDVLDVPRRIIARALLCIEGGKSDNGKPARISEQNPANGRG